MPPKNLASHRAVTLNWAAEKFSPPSKSLRYSYCMAGAVAQSQQLISVEDYLEGERHSEVRHEYVGGHVYAMAGASEDHNRVAGNIFGELRERLRGKRCEPFMVDMKLKIPD